MAPNLQRFCGLIAKARLMETAELEKQYRSWRASAPKERENLHGFIRYLVNQGKVTNAQVEALLTEAVPPTGESPIVPVPAIDEDYEVVLVRARDPKRALDRRDLLMILGGAAAGALAVAIPALIVSSKHKRPSGESTEPSPEKPEP